MPASAVFLDTSIQISRFFKSDEQKRRISERLATFNLVIAGLVVRNEFRRRSRSEDADAPLELAVFLAGLVLVPHALKDEP